MCNNLYSSCLSLMLSSVLFSGCAGVSVMELQDAETLGEGHSSIAVMASTGVNVVELYKDSLRRLDKIPVSVSPFEVHYQTALEDNLDLGISLWNSSFFFKLFPVGKESDSYYDIGVKIQFKRRLTPRDYQRNFSLAATLFGQTAGHIRSEETWKSILYGVAPAIMYSRRFDGRDTPIGSLHRIFPSDIRFSFYAGLKTYFIFTDITYTFPQPNQERRSTRNPILFDPYVGICIGDQKRQFLELHLVIMKNASSANLDVQPLFGLGTRIMF